MLAPVLLLAVPSVALGFFATPLAAALGHEEHFAVSRVGVLALAATLAGLALAWFVHGRRQAPYALLVLFEPAGDLARSGVVDALHLRIYRSLLVRVGAACGWLDRYVVDGAMNVVGAATLVAGRRLRRLQTGNVADYVLAVLAAATLLAAWGALR